MKSTWTSIFQCIKYRNDSNDTKLMYKNYDWETAVSIRSFFANIHFKICSRISSSRADSVAQHFTMPIKKEGTDQGHRLNSL